MTCTCPVCIPKNEISTVPFPQDWDEIGEQLADLAFYNIPGAEAAYTYYLNLSNIKANGDPGKFIRAYLSTIDWDKV